MNKPTAQVSEFIKATPDRVWTALTDPEQIKEYYLGATVETDWKVGSPITWTGEWEGKSYTDKGEILDFDPERHLSYSHWSPLGGTEDSRENYHQIDIDLNEKNGGTEVTLRQSNLSGEETETDRKMRADYEKNWSTMLQGLNKTVTGKR